jgi:hypothetical protein
MHSATGENDLRIAQPTNKEILNGKYFYGEMLIPYGGSVVRICLDFSVRFLLLK